MSTLESNVTSPEWIARLGSADDAVRGPAWQQAGPLGLAAVAPLAKAMTGPDPETARAAKRALWNVVHFAARPPGGGASEAGRAVANAIAAVLGPDSTPVQARREWVWMLSVIGEEETVPVLAALLAKEDLREDARCALQRIPGRRGVEALRRALVDASPEFAPALADALRALGETVRGFPSRRLVPTRSTTVGSKAPV